MTFNNGVPISSRDIISDNNLREHYIEEIDKAMRSIHKLGLKIKELPERKQSNDKSRMSANSRISKHSPINSVPNKKRNFTKSVGGGSQKSIKNTSKM